ncbi:MAG: LamG domain-containing protein [Planctomycetes bacterium]|nr:LamG domain-containing protein [Planctomycetota bacterium]
MNTCKWNTILPLVAVIAAASAHPAMADALPDGVVALWRGEGNAQDSIGQNHGSLVGGTSFTNGIEDQCFAFNGTSGYVELTNAGDLDFGTSNFTVCAWAFFASAGGGLSSDQTLFQKVLGSYPNDRGYFLEYVSGEPQPVLRFMVRDTTSNANDFMLPAPLRVDQWFHIAGVRSGNVNRIYLNGALLGEQQAGSNIDVGSGGTARIGGLLSLTGDARFFRGRLDEVSLYDRALSADQIYRLGTMKPTLSVQAVSDQIEISWTSQSNRSYEIRYSGTLHTNAWTPLGGPILATGAVSVAYDSFPGANTQRFYQVVSPVP